MLFLKRVFPLILCAALCAALSVPACAAARPSVSAESCILVHADTGRVLYEQDAHRQMLIASTTKLLTALVVLDHCALDESVVITADSAGMEGSSMYLRAGQTRTVEQLLYGLLLVSGNDAAMALALHVSGSAGDFAVLMNEKAAALGMTESHFMNPHGLDQEGHYSTAADLATLGVACLESAALLRILSARSYTVEDCVYLNHNKLLWRCQGCVGGKTGYTKAAGRSLVSLLSRDGLRLVCVTLGAPDDWSDHAALYDWACARWKWQRLDSAGSITFTSEGETVAQGPLYFTASVPEKEGIALTPWERFKRVWAMTGRALGPYYYVGEQKV